MHKNPKKNPTAVWKKAVTIIVIVIARADEIAPVAVTEVKADDVKPVKTIAY